MRRLINVSAVTLTLGCAVAVAASAQDSVRVRREPRTFVFSAPGFGGDMIGMHRGRLGITVDLRPDAAHDSVGARVSGVTPGGPADRAGVQTGDIITRLNGARIAGEDRSGEGDEDQSQPGMRLINLASRLDGGDTVRLDLVRGGRPQTLTFVADRTDMDNMVERGRTLMRSMPGFDEGMGRGMGMGFGMEPGGEMRVFANMNPFGDLELVRVNPQLAEGLGIPEGLLVVSIDSSSTLGLHAGDVVTTIGGRRITNPPQAMRILSTYEPGEAVAFDVMRQHRRTTVNGKLPENRRGVWRVRPDMFEEDDMQPMMQRLPRVEIRQRPEMGKIRMDGRV